ncbi:hypothetical protein R1flu_002825 [Riccia fluitans]|uniref:phosphopantothenoylcysteine decarboxylase n=1 Tax=Riccia fluitans TaxID=41844 RepID=A0ABD1Y796_9MARC
MNELNLTRSFGSLADRLVQGKDHRSFLLMHPPLTLHKHPACQEIIIAFKKCHEDHPYTKFLGVCTDLKIQLDKCFRAEKEVKRRANFEASKQFKEKLRARVFHTGPFMMGSKVKLEKSDSPRVSWEKGSTRKPRILLAASGSVAAIKFGILAESLSDWAEVKAVATKSALHFVDKSALPPSVPLYTDEEEWSSWSKIGDEVLHIELRRWADALVIAPLSANTLAKVAGGLCDNLLTCVVRAWDFSKPIFIAPAMNTFMWDSPFTRKHLLAVEELGLILISPIAKKLACGDLGNGAMEEPSVIDSTLRLALLQTMSFNAGRSAKRKWIMDERKVERNSTIDAGEVRNVSRAHKLSRCSGGAVYFPLRVSLFPSSGLLSFTPSTCLL